MKIPAVILGLLLIGNSLSIALSQTPLTATESKLLERYGNAARAKWANEIDRLESLDQQQVASDSDILFIGSSSIRLWNSIGEDIAPLMPVRRGYGGAKLTDLIIFAQRLVANHQYRALVVFVANDITGGQDDRTPEEVLELFQLLVKQVRVHHPNKPIFIVAITPNSQRFKVWPQASAANLLIRQWIETDPLLHYINTVPHYLNQDGRPRDELFTRDQLHQNSEGYKLWGSIIRSQLLQVLDSDSR